MMCIFTVLFYNITLESKIPSKKLRVPRFLMSLMGLQRMKEVPNLSYFPILSGKYILKCETSKFYSPNNILSMSLISFMLLKSVYHLNFYNVYD